MSNPDLKDVPICYHDLAQVFSKAKAKSLPPHHPYDCGIDFFLSLCPLGVDCTLSLLQNIKLWTPTSRSCWMPVSSGLPHHLLERDSSLWKRRTRCFTPAVISVKNKYPLPLIATAFEHIEGARAFTKLDLCNAYHLVCIREGDDWKTAFDTAGGHYKYLVMLSDSQRYLHSSRT